MSTTDGASAIMIGENDSDVRPDEIPHTAVDVVFLNQ